MSRRPVVMHGMLRAVVRFGPECSNKQICYITKQQTWAVSMIIKRAEDHGLITVERAGNRRRIAITESGYAFLAVEDAKPIRNGIITKPAPAYQGEAKKRNCLTCGTGFHSSWPGERICNHCKSLDEWKSSANAAHVAQEVS